MQNPMNPFGDFYSEWPNYKKPCHRYFGGNSSGGDRPQCLVAQSYDRAAAMSGSHGGVQVLDKEIYNNAHLVHCYGHQSNLILQRATSQNARVRIFFSSLSEILSYFSRTPQRMSALGRVCDRRIPTPSTTRWNFKSRTVRTVYEDQDKIIKRCDELESSLSKEIFAGAVGIEQTLQQPDFQFWLQFFAKIMPHVDILYECYLQQGLVLLVNVLKLRFESI